MPRGRSQEKPRILPHKKNGRTTAKVAGQVFKDHPPCLPHPLPFRNMSALDSNPTVSGSPLIATKFRIREPQPDEFPPNELMKPDRGAPVVFCIAVRDPGTGAVVRVVRMLRHRLIPNLRAVGGRS